ncbi:uncharacterized protein K452DRAFT_296436 [Aplosporella prunicola CBS 121167]|uniref:Peroxin 26 n=1 Tax=Aplosporella prunicola CBS 121167 TaxID=1176127 RepID=A0A6A6BJL1_9PEZI|nr:uncharacterized protein K452DRAFT_296436 [Aplosporella prunicola CBS 121167]KAF2144216.1 hypothetical protein K452DRAFT_296436 [Aplosporella prunicola CBS 121167]
MPMTSPNSHHMLSSSISSLSSDNHKRPQTAQIAKAYRQAAQLFLTRRLPEALSTIEPIITPDDQSSHAPVAHASRGTRIKVWSFYLTFLNAVVELGPEEGKHAFGSSKWKALVAKCRDASVWEEVVQAGYAGIEGSVDPDVVVNLATLLLTHAPSQRLTQQRMETYLSASAQPAFDIASHMASPLYAQKRSGLRSNGTNTPRDLNSRLKLLELYTLHVLPRNEEWDYAREFISMSEVLDDERKEAFHLALHSLREEQESAAEREAELRRQQVEQLEQRRRDAEVRRLEAAKAEEEDEARRRRERENEAESRRARRNPDQTNKAQRNRSPPPPPSSSAPPAAGHHRGGSGQSTSSRPAKKGAISPRGPRPGGLAGLVSTAQALVLNAARNMTRNPLAFLRMLLFMLAFALAFGRQDVRVRVRKLLRQAWEKIRQTAGMGVKVSYI